jgi:hypothetical protein
VSAPERAYGGGRLPPVVVCATATTCVVAPVALGVADVAPGTVPVAVAFAAVVAATDLRFATATVPPMAKNDATLSPASSNRVAAAG